MMNKEEFRELMHDTNKLLNFPGIIPVVGIYEEDLYMNIVIDSNESNPDVNDLLSIIYLSDVLNNPIDFDGGKLPHTLRIMESLPSGFVTKYKAALNDFKKIENGEGLEEDVLFLRLDKSVFNDSVTEDDLMYNVQSAIGGSMPDELKELEKILSSILLSQVTSLEKGAYERETYKSQCETMLSIIDSARNNVIDRLLTDITNFIDNKMDKLLSNVLNPADKAEVLTEVNHARYVLENSVMETVNEIINLNRQSVLFRLNNITLLIKYLK